MTYNEKLRIFFKTSGLSQKEVADIMGISPSMMSRFLKGSDNFSSDFVAKLVKNFPQIDLQYIFSENENVEANEPEVNYPQKQLDAIKQIELIEEKIAVLKNYLAQNGHIK